MQMLPLSPEDANPRWTTLSPRDWYQKNPCSTPARLWKVDEKEDRVQECKCEETGKQETPLSSLPIYKPAIYSVHVCVHISLYLCLKFGFKFL